MTPDLLARYRALPPELRAEADALIAQAAAHRRAHPFAHAMLWDRPAPRTSQRRACQRVIAPGVSTAYVLGGNRSGKSQLGAAVCVAYALGRDHPDVVAWGRRNGLDLSGIPTGPGRVFDSALTHGDSRRYVRAKYDELAPQGSRWRAREADNEAELHFPGGGVVIFKAANQGREGYQGDSVRLARFDEEPRDSSVVREATMRLVDQNGRRLHTMTPLYGWTELLRGDVEQPDNRTVVEWLHGTDNPHVPADVLREMLAKYGPHERAARERGEIVALEGRVYAEWEDRAPWVVPAFRVPDAWPRFVGIDWGTSVPTAMVLGAYDEGTDTLHIIGEEYGAGWTIPERVRRIRRLEAGGPPVQLRFADPEDASTNMTIVAEYDVQLSHATKAVRWGINVVASRIAVDALGRTHLVIHDSCVQVRREMSSYVWASAEKPRKIDDHAADALRYLCAGIARQYGLAPGPVSEEGDHG